MGKIFIIVAFSLYILKLAAEDNLTSYIHPRYVVFTIVMAVIGLLVALWLLVMERNQHTSFKFSRPKVLSVFCCIILLLAFALPPQPLMSSAVDQKSNDARIGGLSSGKPLSSPQAGTCREDAGGSNPVPIRTIDGWLSAFANCPYDGGFNGHTAVLEGFVYDPVGSLVSERIFQVSRFFVSCCAVDAAPIGLFVDHPGWRDVYPSDSWVRVQGVLEMREFTPDKKMYIIKNATITTISEPDDPYEYMRW